MKLNSVTGRKRLLSLVLAGTMMLTAFTGCGSDKKDKASKDKKTEIATPIEAEPVDPYPNGVDV